MRKKYFIAFDYYQIGGDLNKFYYGVIDVDMNKIELRDAALEIIVDMHPEIDTSDLTVKVTAFNNVRL